MVHGKRACGDVRQEQGAGNATCRASCMARVTRGDVWRQPKAHLTTISPTPTYGLHKISPKRMEYAHIPLNFSTNSSRATGQCWSFIVSRDPCTKPANHPPKNQKKVKVALDAHCVRRSLIFGLLPARRRALVYCYAFGAVSVRGPRAVRGQRARK